jgi:nicotinamide mononucleotide transporter
MNQLKQLNKTHLALEVLAIVFGVLYTVLYIKGDKTCFYYAFLGAGIYGYLCYKKQLIAETFLQLFYIATAIYGWLNWGEDYTETQYPLTLNLIILGTTIIGVIGVGYLLKQKTKAKLPYIDAFTTVFCISGTWLMVNFVHVNWLYFMGANAVSIFLYYQRGLKLSVLLYAFYVYLAVVGYFNLSLYFWEWGA